MPGNSSILLIADPGAPAVIAERLSDSLPNALTDRSRADDKWDVSVRRHAYPIGEHAEVADMVGTIDPGGETEDIVIYLTDLPRRQGIADGGRRGREGGGIWGPTTPAIRPSEVNAHPHW